jgi:hypothetical protein
VRATRPSPGPPGSEPVESHDGSSTGIGRRHVDLAEMDHQSAFSSARRYELRDSVSL